LPRAHRVVNFDSFFLIFIRVFMRKIALGLGALLLAAAPVAADSKSGETQIALFQQRNIFQSGLRTTHTIALTFDDGPNARTGEVLDALKELNVKATFFIVGNQAHRHPDILRRIAREGHLLANHSATHAFLGGKYDANPAALVDQIRDVHDQIAPLMPAEAKFYFRAPYGKWTSSHARILNRDGELSRYVGPIYWDIGGDTTLTRDGYVLSAADWDCWRMGWSAHTCAKGYAREIRRKDGGVVLMHAIHARSAALVREVVPALIEEGYRFVRLDQMPEYRKYETPGASGVADAPDKLLGATPRIAALRPEDIK
jgi:peptidoglycan/xylan/chitin deacetylase (PgdA/CDA1 family)